MEDIEILALKEVDEFFKDTHYTGDVSVGIYSLSRKRYQWALFRIDVFCSDSLSIKKVSSWYCREDNFLKYVNAENAPLLYIVTP